jgi:hypothetical protein
MEKMAAIDVLARAGAADSRPDLSVPRKTHRPLYRAVACDNAGRFCCSDVRFYKVPANQDLASMKGNVSRYAACTGRSSIQRR